MREFLHSFLGISVAVLVGCGPAEEAPVAPEAPVSEPSAPQAGMSAPAEGIPSAEGFLAVKDRMFVDPEGRQVVLHGAALQNKRPEEGYQTWHRPEDFQAMVDWGMNCIRLAIFWDGVEPEPGKYDEEYLKKVDQRIQWAKEHGLYVFLDMHQDLYSVKYSDGAPEWATLDEGLPHNGSAGIWSDAYFTSLAIQKAFDNFWANAPGPEGVGIQDRFALAWRHVAERYADEPTVIGYDLFNEPNMGTGNLEAQAMMLTGYAKAMQARDGATAEAEDEVIAKWLDREGRLELMKQLCDLEVYKQVLDGPQELLGEFERTQVVPMFQRVTNAIREVDKNHIIFLETLMACNMGVYTGIEPVNGPDGKRDPRQAYAPHGYDIVIGTADNASPCGARVELIFSRHAESSQRLNMPMLIGEWGGFGSNDETLTAARLVSTQFERHLCSDTYWDYVPNTTQRAYFEVLNKAIPVRVAGALVSYQNDFEGRRFACTWKEDPSVKAPSRIYIPERTYPGEDAIRLNPSGAGFQVEPAVEGSGNVYLVIPPTGEAIERTLDF